MHLLDTEFMHRDSEQSEWRFFSFLNSSLHLCSMLGVFSVLYILYMMLKVITTDEVKKLLLPLQNLKK